METAADETAAHRLKKQAVSLDDNGLIERYRDLLARRPGPIAKQSDCDRNRGNANPAPAFLYGWPQCGQIALPSRRFFWQLGHGTRLPFGRVTK